MRRRIIMLVALIVAMYAPELKCQETTGNIEGQLVDQDGQPVTYANIFVTSPSMLGSRATLTSSRGDFRILKLPVGRYTVKISHISYNEMEFREVIVRLGQTTTLGRIELSTRIHKAPVIEVTAERKLIDPSTSSIGATLTNDEFGELPIDRDYKNVANLLPNANESYLGDEVNISGSTGQENKYFIDGAETTDPYLSLTGTNLPYNFVKDIEVRTGGYEAQYRSSLGGIMNVVSRSGSNEFEWQAFGFYVNNKFAGTIRHGVTEPETGDFALYDIGISLGGPIIRDKLWFFASYNPNFSTEEVDIPGTGFHTDKSITHIFSGKLDWKATDRTSMNLTIIGDPNVEDGVGATFGEVGIATSFEEPDPFLVDVRTGGINAFAKMMHMFSDNLFLEASASRITRTIYYQGATEIGRTEQLFIDEETGTWSGGYPTPTDDYSRQWTTALAATAVLGKHTIKTGIEYRDNNLDFNEEWIVLHRYSDTNFREVYFTSGAGTVGNRIPSAFIQDSWRLTERLRLNAGLRWDGQYIIGSDGKTAQKISDQYQPRIGFIFQPGELGTQKVFGSFGRFYQELALATAVNSYNEHLVFRITNWDHDPRIDPSGGDVTEYPGEIEPEVDGLKGQHYDEFVLGYERQLGSNFTVGARGIYRTLREAIEDGYSENLGRFTNGNPGSGALSDFPKAKRDYKALEISLQTFGNERYQARISYVLSRNEGNYPGLYMPSAWMLPNHGPLFDLVEGMEGADGRLPNDRPHVFKLSGSFQAWRGFTVGSSFSWMTGTPRSVIVATSWGYPYMKYDGQRGSYGRAPDIWDLNLRFAYDLKKWMSTSRGSRLILDIFHLGSQREPVVYDEIQYFNQDTEGNPTDPNPSFGMVTAYQPPTAIRLGFELDL